MKIIKITFYLTIFSLVLSSNMPHFNTLIAAQIPYSSSGNSAADYDEDDDIRYSDQDNSQSKTMFQNQNEDNDIDSDEDDDIGYQDENNEDELRPPPKKRRKLNNGSSQRIENSNEAISVFPYLTEKNLKAMLPKILNYLAYNDLHATARVSTFFRELIDNSRKPLSWIIYINRENFHIDQQFLLIKKKLKTIKNLFVIGMSQDGKNINSLPSIIGLSNSFRLKTYNNHDEDWFPNLNKIELNNIKLKFGILWLLLEKLAPNLKNLTTHHCIFSGKPCYDESLDQWGKSTFEHIIDGCNNLENLSVIDCKKFGYCEAADLTYNCPSIKSIYVGEELSIGMLDDFFDINLEEINTDASSKSIETVVFDISAKNFIELTGHYFSGTKLAHSFKTLLTTFPNIQKLIFIIVINNKNNLEHKFLKNHLKCIKNNITALNNSKTLKNYRNSKRYPCNAVSNSKKRLDLPDMCDRGSLRENGPGQDINELCIAFNKLKLPSRKHQ